MGNFYNFILMFKSSEKCITIEYFDRVFCRRENAGRRRLRAVQHQTSVARFVWIFSPVSLRVERKLTAGSGGYFTYLHLV